MVAPVQKVLASTNRSKTSIVEELTPGTTPANPKWQELSITKNGLKLKPTRGRSKDVRSDGQAGGTFLLDLMPEGGLDMEFKFQHWDWALSAAIKTNWNNKATRDNAGTADSVITAVTASSDSYTVTDGVPIDFNVGDLVLASGFGPAANNSVFRAATGTNGTTIVAPSAPGLSDEAAPPANARLKAIGVEGASGDITATATGIASTVLDFTTRNILAGEWHYFEGAAAENEFATAANRGWARVSSVSANAINYDVLPAGWSVDDGAGKKIQLYFGDVAINGTTVRSFSSERRQIDLGKFEYFRGLFVNNLNLQITAAKEIDMSIDFVGFGGDPMGTVRFSGSSDIAAPTYGTMTASNNIGDLVEGGVSLIGGANCMSSGSIKIANNYDRKPVAGPLGSAGINVGSLMVSGDIDTYLGDQSLLAKGPNDTPSAFAFNMGYSAGNREGYRFDVTNTRLTTESDIPGGNEARSVKGPYEAEPHPTLGHTISIGRFHYLPAA